MRQDGWSPLPSPTCPRARSRSARSTATTSSGPASRGTGCAARSQRANYVGDVAKALRRALRPPTALRRPQFRRLAARALAAPGRSATSPQCSSRTSTAPRRRCARRSSTARRAGPAVPAVGRLVDWATDDPAGRAAAVRAARRRRHGQDHHREAVHPSGCSSCARRATRAAPADPVRPARRPRRDPGHGDDARPRSSTRMLDATRPPAVPASGCAPTSCARRLAQGDAVVVFDGLDEVLVHLDRCTTGSCSPASCGGRSTGSPAAGCCSPAARQYFRTIRDEADLLHRREPPGPARRATTSPC